MAKSANQKLKLLRLYDILMRQSDEEHPIPVPELIQELERYDIKAERKSIYDDLDALAELGVDVQSRKGRTHTAHNRHMHIFFIEAEQLTDTITNTSAHLQRRSFSPRRTSKQMSNNATDKNQWCSPESESFLRPDCCYHTVSSLIISSSCDMVQTYN